MSRGPTCPKSKCRGRGSRRLRFVDIDRDRPNRRDATLTIDWFTKGTTSSHRSHQTFAGYPLVQAEVPAPMSVSVRPHFHKRHVCQKHALLSCLERNLSAGTAHFAFIQAAKEAGLDEPERGSPAGKSFRRHKGKPRGVSDFRLT